MSDHLPACEHRRVEVGPLEADICDQTSIITWYDGDDLVDATVAMARVFGAFDLVETLPAIGAPGPLTSVYEASTRRERSWLLSLPRHRFLEAMPGVWISRDDSHLLITPRLVNC